MIYTRLKPQNIELPDGVKITKLPPGEAVGARDLQHWIGNGVPRDDYSRVRLIILHCKRCGHTSEFVARKSFTKRINFKCSECRRPIFVKWGNRKRMTKRRRTK